jgi:ankyrin repeat protein
MSTGLFDAIALRDMDRLAALLSGGSDPNAIRDEPPRWTALHEAIDEVEDGGPIEAIVLLLRHGADVNGRAYPQSAPLPNALFRDLPAVVHLLLASGADVNCRGDEGDSPLRVCVEKGDYSMVSTLLRCGATKTINDAGGPVGVTALGRAAYGLDEVMVRLLLEAGADPNARDADGRTALERMRFRGHLFGERGDDPRWIAIENLLSAGARKG